MKRTLLFILLIASTFANAQTASSIHTHTALVIDSTLFNFSSYFGKKILIVNTASYCGYTSQYGNLETLYQTYKSNNFEILGFPCNDFGAQEPGKDSTIAAFCSTNYGVTFKMMSKISITASDTDDVYKWLQRGSLNGVASNPVDWNFNKYLIDEAGKLHAWHTSSVSPLDTAITNWIMKPSVITTGVSEQHNLNAELISQNPVTDNIELMISNNSGASYSVEMYGIDGKLVRTISDNNLASKKISFSFGDLSPGMYFVRIQNNLYRKDIKLVVTK